MITKICTGCNEEKPLNEYHKKRDGKYGHTSQCKICSCARTRKWYKENPDKRMRWYYEHREHSIARAKRWKEENKDRVREYKREYRKKNKQAIQQYQREWIKEHPNYFRQWREDNKERNARLAREWAKNNPEKVRARGHRYRARKRNNGGAYTTKEWLALCDKYNWICLACGTPHEKQPLTVDHIIPISKGGHSNITNIQPLCLKCNQSKGAKSIDYRY